MKNALRVLDPIKREIIARRFGIKDSKVQENINTCRSNQDEEDDCGLPETSNTNASRTAFRNALTSEISNASEGNDLHDCSSTPLSDLETMHQLEDHSSSRTFAHSPECIDNHLWAHSNSGAESEDISHLQECPICSPKTIPPHPEDSEEEYKMEEDKEESEPYRVHESYEDIAYDISLNGDPLGILKYATKHVNERLIFDRDDIHKLEQEALRELARGNRANRAPNK